MAIVQLPGSDDDEHPAARTLAAAVGRRREARAVEGREVLTLVA
jgi:hypothetical protein